MTNETTITGTIGEVETAVHRLLAEMVADRAQRISFSALLDDSAGDGVTLAEGISFLTKYSPTWGGFANPSTGGAS